MVYDRPAYPLFVVQIPPHPQRHAYEIHLRALAGPIGGSEEGRMHDWKGKYPESLCYVLDLDSGLRIE